MNIEPRRLLDKINQNSALAQNSVGKLAIITQPPERGQH